MSAHDEATHALPSVPHGGWLTYPLRGTLSIRPPNNPCPHCAVEGRTSRMLVGSVTIVGGQAALIWHMYCEDTSHYQHYPAFWPEEDPGEKS